MRCSFVKIYIFKKHLHSKLNINHIRYQYMQGNAFHEGKGDNNLNFSQIGIIRKELLSKIFYFLNLLLVQKF